MRVRAGDVGLEEHLKTFAKNASYISKTTQNEVIKGHMQPKIQSFVNFTIL